MNEVRVQENEVVLEEIVQEQDEVFEEQECRVCYHCGEVIEGAYVFTYRS